MAEREGFEPSIQLLTVYSLSRRAPSATRPSLHSTFLIGGGGRIRTHGTLPRTAVFKTAALNHSATPPERAWARGRTSAALVSPVFQRADGRGVMRSTPKYGRSASGTSTVPSARW